MSRLASGLFKYFGKQGATGSPNANGSAHVIASKVVSESEDESVKKRKTCQSQLEPPSKRRRREHSEEERAPTQLDGRDTSLAQDESRRDSKSAARTALVDAIVPQESRTSAEQDSDDDDDLPTPRALRSTWSKPVLPTTSFASSSTLSGLPPSSQISVVSSSHRTWKGGEQIVTNSSSDGEDLERISEEGSWASESEGEDEVELLIARKKQEIAADRESTGTAEQDRFQDAPVHGSARHRHKPTSSRTYPTPPKNEYKHSLATLAKQKRKDEALEARLRVLEETDKRAEARIGALKALDGGGETTSAEVAQTLTEEDHEQLRLRQALERADALEHEVRFRFFDSVLEDDPTRLPFPKSQKGWASWMAMLKDAGTLGHNVAFVADLCYSQALPPELQEWCLSELLFEDRDEVADAYVNILTECARHESPSSLLDVPMLRDSMTRLGAKDELVYHHQEPEDAMDEQKGKKPSRIGRKGLQHFLTLLANVSDRLDARARETAVYFAALMLVDDEVAVDISMSSRVQRTCDSLLDATPDDGQRESFERITNDVNRHIQHPVLIHRLISSLGLSYDNHKTALFRRAMAYQSLLGIYPTKSDLASGKQWTTMIDLVHTSPDFSTTLDTTDFPILAARLSLLDVAIGPGFAAPDTGGIFVRPAPSRPAEEDQSTPQERRAASFFAPRKTNKMAETEEEVAFNAGVDGLSAALRAAAGRIRDAGAAHMRRAECKGVLEALAGRLDWAVRTKRRARKGVFGR